LTSIRAGESVDGVDEAGAQVALGSLLGRLGEVDRIRVDKRARFAVGLGPVHGSGREVQQLVLRRAVARERDDARAHAERRGLDPRADAIHDEVGRPDVGVDQREHELVAADAAADVAGPQLVAQGGGDRAQRRVAGRVAAGAVDELEVVEVERDDGDRIRVRPAGSS
jgi:hypothetical protein